MGEAHLSESLSLAAEEEELEEVENWYIVKKTLPIFEEKQSNMSSVRWGHQIHQ